MMSEPQMSEPQIKERFLRRSIASDFYERYVADYWISLIESNSYKIRVFYW